MNRFNRKTLIEELEYLRMGFRSAHDFLAKSPAEKESMRAHHFFANMLVEKYGGKKVEDIERSLKPNPISRTVYYTKSLENSDPVGLIHSLGKNDETLCGMNVNHPRWFVSHSVGPLAYHTTCPTCLKKEKEECNSKT